jgi:serine/threonine protein kinase
MRARGLRACAGALLFSEHAPNGRSSPKEQPQSSLMQLPPSRSEEIRRLFDQVTSLPLAKRERFLDTVCRDRPDLKAELSSLLEHTGGAGGVLDPIDTELSAIVRSVFDPSAPGDPGASDAPGASGDPHASDDPAAADEAPGDPAERGADTSHGDEDIVGRTISRYEVVQRVGSGGMGVVYMARDPRLGRRVALKCLPKELSSDETAKQQFIREARAASAIEHPNICPIYDIDETEDGRLFIAMAFIEGETLRDRLDRGPLALEEAVGIGVQAAKALGRAHESGIVHRDVKPANIMVDPYGTVRLLDFGIAKLASEADAVAPGVVAGTAAYMSPEQIHAEGVDHRTDVWSLGVVMYEMIAGVRPFEGAYEQAVLYSILNSEPEALIRYCEDRDVAAAVHRALEKRVSDRHADMSGFRAALLAAKDDRPPAHRDKSILVLPFDDVSPEQDNQYFSDGLSEELISGLSQIGSLRVICRTSAWQAKASRKDVATLRRELDVEFVLDGSVRKVGSRVRVTPQLIDASTQATVWSNRYDGNLEDIFDIQDRVAQSTIASLKLQLSDDESARLSRRPIGDPQAFECYLRARQAVLEYTPESLAKALRHLHEGLDIVGENALLHAGIGYVHFTYANIGLDRDVHLARARAHAEDAFRLEADSPQAYRLLGLLAVLEGDQREAIRQLRRAYDEDPHDLETLQWLHMMYPYVGLTSDAWPIVKRELSLDPLNPVSRAAPGWLHFMEGRFDLALTPYRHMYETDPENPVFLYYYAQILAYTDDVETALSIIDRLVAIMPEHPYAMLSRCFGYALRKESEKMEASVTPDVVEMARNDLSHAWYMAVCYSIAGKTQTALDWLETAVDLGFVNYPFLADKDRHLEPLRKEERFQELMQRVRSMWESVALEFEA